jgi:hypothetical protein
LLVEVGTELVELVVEVVVGSGVEVVSGGGDDVEVRFFVEVVVGGSQVVVGGSQVVVGSAFLVVVVLGGSAFLVVVGSGSAPSLKATQHVRERSLRSKTKHTPCHLEDTSVGASKLFKQRL